MEMRENQRGSGNGPVHFEGDVTFSPEERRPNAARSGVFLGSCDAWMPCCQLVGYGHENSDDTIVVRRHGSDFLTRLPVCRAPAPSKCRSTAEVTSA